MSNIVIEVEGLSKQYRLGEIGTGSLAHDFNRWWYRIRGKEDPYLKIGEENDRTIKGFSHYAWALNGISFNVKKGEILGVIGRNGAGKSTLLKILSRTTTPTEGSVKIKGKVASLLEVGTGFHPELSGRDNVYLNGSILGMRKHEIKSKFDEIVSFAGVEKYIDTPVKRYSSGMYVRLAFAVAAHLEPEILIVDEVLAVGDIEFQKKCLGKMKDVSNEQGRTVLFVSHNMNAVKSLCTSAVYLHNGKILNNGNVNEVINTYLYHNNTSNTPHEYANPQAAPGNEFVRLKKIRVVPESGDNNDLMYIDTSINIEFEFWNNVTDKEVNLSLVLYTIADECVFNVGTEAKYLSEGVHKGICRIPANLLNDGTYKISMMIVAEKSYPIFYFEDIINFEINENRETSGWHGKLIGLIRPKLNFSLE